MTFKIEVAGRMVSVNIVKNLDAQIAEALEKQLEFANTEIKTRTRGGLDSNNAPFVPYSKAYAKQRREEGRSDKIVDLIRTGAMSRAQKTKINRKGNSGQIYFNSAKESLKATRIMEGIKRSSDGVQNARNFFAFGADLAKRIIQGFKQLINISEANK